MESTFDPTQAKHNSDQITGDLLEGVGTRGQNRKKRRMRRMGVHFVLLARSTPTDIIANKGCKAWPPKFRSNKLASFENTRVTGGEVVMVADDDGKAKVGGNVDVALISQNTGVIMPIGKVGAEFGRNFSAECIKGIKDEWVRGGGVELGGEGGINEVDKEGVREEGHCFIVRVMG